MKNLVKIFLLVLLTSAFGGNLFAQSSVTNEEAVITVSANVLAPLSIIKNTDVDFKNISATTTGVVRITPHDGNGNSVYSYAGNGATMGQFTINADDDTDVLISYENGVILENSNQDPLPFSVHVFGDSIANPLTSSAQLSNEGVAGTDVLRTTHPTTGNYYLFIGGALGGTIGTPEELDGQATGTYTGTMTFEVKYN